MTEIDYDGRAAKGAALLDERYPGWALTVNRDHLNMGDTQYCVAAQVVCDSEGPGAYIYAMDELNLTGPSDTVERGFSLSRGEAHQLRGELGTDDHIVVYAPLTEAWMRQINARLTPSG